MSDPSLFLPPYLMFSLLIAAAMSMPATLPPSAVRVEAVARPTTNSVQFYDNKRNITNRVLDRSIYTDVRRVHTDLHTGEVFERRERVNRLAVEQHCRTRLRAEALSESECGSGFTRN